MEGTDLLWGQQIRKTPNRLLFLTLQSHRTSLTAPHAAPLPYQTVALQRFHQRTEGVSIQHQALGHVLYEVKILVCRTGLFLFLLGRPAFIGGAFQVKFQVHFHHARQNVVHHDHADVFAPRLHTVQSIKLRQQCPWVLVEILQQGGEKEHRER